jgi:hypothetical protein
MTRASVLAIENPFVKLSDPHFYFADKRMALSTHFFAKLPCACSRVHTAAFRPHFNRAKQESASFPLIITVHYKSVFLNNSIRVIKL